MIAGFHTTALHEHDWGTARALLRQIGYVAVGVRLSRARLDPLAEPGEREEQIERLSKAFPAEGSGDRGSGNKKAGGGEWIIDADGRYLIDPWSPCIGDLMAPGAARERRLECLKGAIGIAARIGGRLVTFASGRLPPAMDAEQGLERLREAVLELAPLAERASVTLAIRPRPDHFVDSVGRFERLTEWLADRADLQLAADVGTMVAGGEMPIVDLLVRSRRLACVYLSDVRWVAGGSSAAEALIGSSQVAAERVVEGLAEHGFRGPTLVEPAHAELVDPSLAAAFYERIFGRVAGGPPSLDTLS